MIGFRSEVPRGSDIVRKDNDFLILRHYQPEEAADTTMNSHFLAWLAGDNCHFGPSGHHIGHEFCELADVDILERVTFMTDG